MNLMNQKIAKQIRTAVSKKNPNAEVILFGSRARGKENMKSDWDILILLNSPSVDRNTEKEYREELFGVELETGQPISTFVFSKNEWQTKFSVTPLFKNIQKDGIRL